MPGFVLTPFSFPLLTFGIIACYLIFFFLICLVCEKYVKMCVKGV